MGSVFCAELRQQKKFYQSHQLNAHMKLLRAIEIPPRKLHGRRIALAAPADKFSDSFKSNMSSLQQMFLPCNNADDEDDDLDAPYNSDYFRMYEFKVQTCARDYGHNWMECPFAHPGEKAGRRDLRKYLYCGTMCPEFRRGYCPRGDSCGFAHGVFECWLHPSRYRTEACKDGRNCTRRVCFFAHTPRQIRIVPDECLSPPVLSPVSCEKTFVNNHCCCCHHSGNFMGSPNLCLAGILPVSPPISPSIPLETHREFPPLPRSGATNYTSGWETSFDKNLTRLMDTLEAMNVGDPAFSYAATAKKGKSPWMNKNHGDSEENQNQRQFPPLSTPKPVEDFSGMNLLGNSCDKEAHVKWTNDLVE